ncbi:1-deoxy-D-xylulose-5-phosphate synthase [Streptomyces jeddahensis]|uniref:1-deoxy-D-xylulose-5-phosphate synthase n=1 Tax=Streptomyces jeddahensis TaxID=1716141 RepID=A0A177HLG8_9ACTN|nr:1-deoxy-D-xylulose-5-phosphate synthase [Streptomyces jeddahensis]OAH11257.1 1-deoxy-D-xylulose-5-phosphate synthase [Streptomyces jeddahensis]
MTPPTAVSAVNLLRTASESRALRAMTAPQLAALAQEMRDLMLDVVARTGGHLGSNLGVVELTIALHRVYTSPYDRLLFDTGHQVYPHKLLTGRWNRFAELRKSGGLSGYASQAESEHDVIENSHASTVLSYADGLAKAYRLTGQDDRQVVAVIGDGALTGGMAWEALNNIAAAKDRRVTVVLNDNGRSYSPTIGGIAEHLAASREGTGEQPPGELFRSLGLGYLGPVDGHDITALEAALTEARTLGPTVVHVVTRKGFGYPPAEADDDEKFHAPGLFDPATGRKLPSTGTSWTGVFGKEMVRIGAERPDVVALTAAMMGPTGLAGFCDAYPERTFDVGIAEQHAMGSAAGLALGGLRPVLAVYATFLNRAFDQLLMDAALHRLGLTVVLDRAGVTGDDGPSHNGMWDLSILQVVPGLRIAAPRDAARLRSLLRAGIDIPDGPTVVRFPKGAVPEDLPAIGRIGELDVLSATGAQDVLVVAVGPLARAGIETAALLRAQGLGATVVDPRWVKPLDPALAALARRHRLVLVAEDSCRSGGVGDAVARLLRDADVDTPVRTFGIPAAFLEHAGRAQILDEIGLTSRHMARSATEFLARRSPMRWPLPVSLGGPHPLSSTTATRETAS